MKLPWWRPFALAAIVLPLLCGCGAEGVDSDGDGYEVCANTATSMSLSAAADLASGATPGELCDCNDSVWEINPGALDTCSDGDGVDNDCDGSVDEGECDAQTPTVPTPTPAAPTATPTAPSTPEPTPVPTPTAVTDRDGDGVPAAADCDDTDAAVYPGAPELCDGRDNDCNSATRDAVASVRNGETLELFGAFATIDQALAFTENNRGVSGDLVYVCGGDDPLPETTVYGKQHVSIKSRVKQASTLSKLNIVNSNHVVVDQFLFRGDGEMTGDGGCLAVETSRNIGIYTFRADGCTADRGGFAFIDEGQNVTLLHGQIRDASARVGGAVFTLGGEEWCDGSGNSWISSGPIGEPGEGDPVRESFNKSEGVIFYNSTSIEGGAHIHMENKTSGDCGGVTWTAVTSTFDSYLSGDAGIVLTGAHGDSQFTGPKMYYTSDGSGNKDEVDVRFAGSASWVGYYYDLPWLDTWNGNCYNGSCIPAQRVYDPQQEPTTEVYNGLDDDLDGTSDEYLQNLQLHSCTGSEFRVDVVGPQFDGYLGDGDGQLYLSASVEYDGNTADETSYRVCHASMHTTTLPQEGYVRSTSVVIDEESAAGFAELRFRIADDIWEDWQQTCSGECTLDRFVSSEFYGYVYVEEVEYVPTPTPEPTPTPSSEEVCDGVDNDADGVVDEGPDDGLTYYVSPAAARSDFISFQVSTDYIHDRCDGNAGKVVLEQSVSLFVFDTLQEAFDLATRGSVVYICEGVHDGADLENKPDIYLTLLGEGTDKSVITSSDGRGLQFLSIEGVDIRHLTLRGNRASDDEPRGGAIKFKDGEFFIFEDVLFEDNFAPEHGGCMHLNGVAHVYGFDSTFDSCGVPSGGGDKGGGVYIRPMDGGSGTYAYFGGCRFYGTGLQGGDIYVRRDSSALETARADIDGTWMCSLETDSLIAMDHWNRVTRVDERGILDGECSVSSSGTVCTAAAR